VKKITDNQINDWIQRNKPNISFDIKDGKSICTFKFFNRGKDVETSDKSFRVAATKAVQFEETSRKKCI
jgi:hypothetical protein